MKPLHIFLLMWAIGITALADGISMALAPIPGLGIVLALALTFCINATMGVGLLFTLVANGMFHPKFGPAGITLGLVPPFNFLPIWLGLVAAGIVHDLSKEKGALGEVAKLADTLQSSKNPLSRARAVMNTSQNLRDMRNRPAADSPQDGEEQKPKEKVSRTLPSLKSPALAPTMSSDIAPQRARKNTYAQPA